MQVIYSKETNREILHRTSAHRPLCNNPQNSRAKHHSQQSQSAQGNRLIDNSRALRSLASIVPGLCGGRSGSGSRRTSLAGLCRRSSSRGRGVVALGAENVAILQAAASQAVDQVADGLALGQAVQAAVMVVFLDRRGLAALVEGVGGVVFGGRRGAGGVGDGDFVDGGTGAGGGSGGEGGCGGRHFVVCLLVVR